MFRTRIGILATIVVGYAVSLVRGQQSGWVPNQVNATMCYWEMLRGAQIRDTVYLDGGNLYWVPGMADGTYGAPVDDGNPLGLIYMLNFSTPFNSSTNVSSILTTLSKAAGGGDANNLGPNYLDGAMLANDDEFFLYGGMLELLSEYSAPYENQVLGYEAYDYGTVKPNFRPGFSYAELPNGMTRYLTFGGAASAPSENKAWYFGGYTSEDWGPIYQPDGNDSTDPTRVSNTFITLDMSIQQQETWSNVTLPSNIPSRANPSVVWVPVGAQGILVVLGGVDYPSYDNANMSSQNQAQSQKDSPGYLSNINIYDIAGDAWYTQPTIAGPDGQLAQACAVVATAQDQSSYNIYYYGGWDGIHPENAYNDDVWILSLPSFMWMKVSSGTADHARAGHQCVTPYPDQMVVIGGKRPTVACLDGGILQVFNLTTATWLDSYDPEVWNPYGVPEMIHLMIGGDYSGGATMTTPTPSGWGSNTALASVFQTKYPTTTISTYYPYGTADASGTPRGTVSGSGKGGTPSWVAPVLGVVLGLVFVTAIVVGILLYRRWNLLQKKKGESDNPSSENGNRISAWIQGQDGGGDKAETVTTEVTSTRFDDMESSRHGTPMHGVFYQGQAEMRPYEMPNNNLVELGDTSPRVELSGDPRAHDSNLPQFSTISTPRSINYSTPFFANSLSHDQVSSVNSSQPAMASSGAVPSEGQRADSPPLGNTSHFQSKGPSRDAIVSDLSHISESQATHLRNLSNTTSGSGAHAAAGASPPVTPEPAQTSFHTGMPGSPLVSPPSAIDGREAIDYMSVHPGRSLTGSTTSHPSRRSVFREHDIGNSSEHDAGQ
ncbi:hypothetical protein F5Y16DRAFT_317630 [Xylariaceae sp. FL0255]|nr:hypothetical protein F5Y16DRAFT_317630 [Xylariaceae sp. FL0255]